MLVLGQNGQGMLPAQSPDPDVVGRNWRPSAFHLNPKRRIVNGGFGIHGKDLACGDQLLEPQVVLGPKPGLCDSEPKLSEND